MPSLLPGNSGNRRTGFVLVSVLLLIAVVTVVVVVGSMMAQIERKAASNAARIELARVNALFAMQVALDQLQTAAGPDQRITARAEILDGDSSTVALEGVAQPYWTGVWKSGASGPDIVNSGNPQRVQSLGAANPTAENKATSATWLVSNPGSNPSAISPLNFAGVTSGPARDAVEMARNLGRDATVSTVIVPLVTMEAARGGATETTGAYAYWVSDEGVKAKVNQAAPTLEETGIVERQLHHLTTQAAAPHKGILGSANTTDLRGIARAELPKVSTLSSMQNLPGVVADSISGISAANLSADATTHGAGVLADVRRGGLRKDLTATFENGAAFTAIQNDFGHGAGMLYRSASSANLTVPTINTGVTPPTDGLHWFTLYAFYNAYKGQMAVPSTGLGNPNPSRASITPVSGGDPSAMPGTLAQRVVSLNFSGTNPTTAKLGALMPVPIAYRVDIALSSYEQAGVWKLRLHYYPQLVLWNPYGVRLQLANYQFQRNVGAFSTSGATKTSISVNVGGSAIPAVVLNQSPDNVGNRLQLRTAAGAAAVLEPGETRVFALDADADKSNPLEAITFSDLVSNPGMSADFSQTTDLPGFAGVPNGTATVRVTLSDRRLRCQNVDTFVIPDGAKWPFNDGASTNTTTRYSANRGWDTAATQANWDDTLQIQQLNGTPRRIIGFYVRTKGLTPSSGTRTYTNASTTVPIFSGNAAPASIVDDNFSFSWQEVYLSPLGSLYQNGETDVQIAPSGTAWETSVGIESAGFAAPGRRLVLRDVPRLPMISLGQFMHMPTGNFRSIGVYEQLMFGSMFVGGSYASPIMDTDRNALSVGLGTAAGGAPNMRLFFDDSYLANEALFDRFFLSTVPPAALDAPGTNYPAYWNAFNSANPGASLSDASLPLLNTRMRPVSGNGTPPLMADLRDANKAAANLLLDGAFNINSTSVEAWKAVLGGISGSMLDLFDATLKSSRSVDTSGGTPVSRFWSASGTTDANRIWSGLRILSDSELDSLALAIVRQVKTRGPFLSLADFLNRRLGSPGPLTRSGALQTAIDATSINDAVKSAGREVNAGAPPEPYAPEFQTNSMRNSSGEIWNTSLGAPGYLMQQDLVQVLAPVISARSDTFVIRTYGEVRNPTTGTVEGHARAEAVVQRLPALADSSQAPESSQATIETNPTNRAFGRRFQITSFRWLADEEV